MLRGQHRRQAAEDLIMLAEVVIIVWHGQVPCLSGYCRDIYRKMVYSASAPMPVGAHHLPLRLGANQGRSGGLLLRLVYSPH